MVKLVYKIITIMENFLNQLADLQQKGLADSAIVNIKKWLGSEEYQSFWPEIGGLIEEKNITELNDAFYKVIPFGTGGRRGKMGVGTNRINARTIAESAQGVADYLKDFFGEEEIKRRGAVVTYDVRHNSRAFAEVAAGVFAANGLKVYFYDGVRSTPQISFTVRFKKAIAGAMISASHNPPSDNGIKIYWANGGQILPPHDVGVIEKVSQVDKINILDFQEAVATGKIVMLGEEVDSLYQEAVAQMSLGNFREAKIVFTPLNGCAVTSFLPVLHRLGFKNIIEVKEQMTPDPDFLHVAKQIPNPEVPISLDLATQLAKKEQADLVVAADPDADRIGVVSRKSLAGNDFVFLNGNQIAVLLLDYIIKRKKANQTLPQSGVVIKTVVTTELLAKIAIDNNLEVIGDTPVGFKYIAEAIDNQLAGREFIFGAEESHGYLFGDYARDKDGAVAALLICEYASWLKQENKTLFEQLEEIKKKYGYFRELLQAIYFTGMDGMVKMEKIMNVLRADLPKEINGFKVVSVLDQLNKKFIDPQSGLVVGDYKGYADNALIFYLNAEKTDRVVVRPSGTEPKIKFYVAVGKEVGLDKTEIEYEQIKQEANKQALALLELFVKRAEEISPGGERFEILG